jgi:hypothetical protein
MPIIGREPPADIVIAAPQVSARHAEIQPLGGDLYRLIDLGSTNGTFVNGQRIQSAQVRLSDAVRFGSLAVDLRLYVPQAPPPLPATHLSAGPPLPARAPAPVAASSPPTPVQARGPVVASPGLGTDLAVALAAQKSFTGNAFFTWVLYWFGWLPGVIMNFVYLNEAKGVQKLTGQSPPGMGCLTLLIITHFLIPLILIALLVLTGGAIVSSLLAGIR